MNVEIVEPARCTFCHLHRGTRNLIGPAGLITAFVLGMAVADDTTIQSCDACADAMKAAIMRSNAARATDG